MWRVVYLLFNRPSEPVWSAGCKALQTLQLEDNAFVGGLQSGWAFQQMERLSLQGNQLTGPIPDSWASNFPSLSQLILLPQAGSSQVCGTIPSGVPVYEQVGGTISLVGSLEPSPGDPSPPPPPLPPPPPGRTSPLPAPGPTAGGLTSATIIAIVVGLGAAVLGEGV